MTMRGGVNPTDVTSESKGKGVALAAYCLCDGFSSGLEW